MRLAILCPVHPPEPGGVADYLERLCAQLVKEGHEVANWTACANPSRIAGTQVFVVPGSWGRKEFERIEGELREWRPDAVIVQFTPYLYGKRGLNFHLPMFLRGLSARLGSAPAGLMVHELHYPLGFTPDRLLLGTPQFLQFLALFRAAERVAFTNEIPTLRFGKLAPWKKVSWITAGATIEPDPNVRPVTSFEGKKILLQFGSSHPSRMFRQSFEAVRAANEAGIPSTLVFLGMTSEEIRKNLLEESLPELEPHLFGTGYVSPAEASAWLTRADLVLSPFIDGISSRRSSAISAFAHGKAVVTTKGYLTDPSVPWESFCAISEIEDSRSFERNVIELLRDSTRGRELGEAARKFYIERFSWPVIARKIVDWISGSSA